MYKYLLANRYLRTRFIALASIISVTLGVATMIVVNSVMAGFSTQMRDRIRNILADVVIETTSMDGTEDPRLLMQSVEELVGDDIAAMSPTVEVFGMMSFRFAGKDVYRPVTLIGIVPESKNLVSPLAKYLLSRQDVIENDELVRAAMRSDDVPLDWSMTEEAQKHREDYVKWRQLQEQYPGLTGNRLTSASPEGDATAAESKQQAAAVAPTQLDPFAAAANASAEDVPAPEPATDPYAPLPAKVYMGAGLISFQNHDASTGKTHTVWYVNPGEDVILTTVKTGMPEPATFKATVVDVFKSGMSEYDANLVFCNLEELQFIRGMVRGPDPTRPHENLNWKDGAITTLQIKLKDYDDAPEVIHRLKAGLPWSADISVRTWEQKQGPLLEAVDVESTILNILLFLIIAVAGFGILAIFYMIVVEKTRDIGIMKALGASSKGIMSIFLFYGLALGLVGSGAGVTMGLLFVRYINEIEELISAVTGQKVFDDKIYYFQEIPTAVHPSMVLWVALGAMLIAVLASVLPARRAARLHPVQALRYE